VHQFTSLAEAQTTIEAWRLDYHPRRSLGHLTPNEFVGQCQALQTVEEVGCSRLALSRNGTNVSARRFSFWTIFFSGELTLGFQIVRQCVLALLVWEAGKLGSRRQAFTYDKRDLRYKRFGRFENENEKIRLNMFCQHGKVHCAEFTRLR